MTARRVGLVLAVLLSLLGLLPALDVSEDQSGGGVAVAVLVAVAALVVLAGTVGLLVPAWRGGRRSGTGIAALQLVAALSGLPAFFAPPEVLPPGGVLAAALGCLFSIGVAVLILIDYSGALRYVLAATAVVAIYAGLVAAGSALLPPSAGRAVATLGALVVALLYQPVSALVRRLVGRPLFAGGADPAGTALELSRASGQGEPALDLALAEAVRVMRLHSAELVLDQERIATAGTAHLGATELSLDLGGEPPLVFTATLPARARGLEPDDREALELVARTLGALARETALSAQLAETRAALVQARAAERSVVHRELHDGLGPMLTGIALRMDATRNLLTADPVAATVQLDQARADLRAAIAEVRRVCYGLRP